MASQPSAQPLSPDMDITSFIGAMPKAELHVHLEGCLTPKLARELAQRNNLPLPPSLSALDQTGSNYAFHDLTTFLQVYYPNLAVLQTAQDFADVAISYLSVAYRQNVKHCELFFDPQAHTSRGVPFPTVVRGYQAGILTAQRSLGISASLIMCFLRDQSAEYAMATLMESLPFKDIIIGVGLDSDERDNPPSKFAAVSFPYTFTPPDNLSPHSHPYLLSRLSDPPTLPPADNPRSSSAPPKKATSSPSIATSTNPTPSPTSPKQ